ncbi:MAG TPA: L,D-transpeptidase [Chitinophagaceae bacterium]|jgi:murein L,D-transpeptidase YafK|nr:L,D-transpeptidase [Chitinophagaceae bacterium]
MKSTIALAAALLGSSIMFGPTSSEMVVTGTVHSDVNHRSTDDPIGTVYIIIDKSDYELSVYDSKGWYATYPVVFGNNSLADKKMEGDRNTPEGTFRIVSKRYHAKWDRFMALDYPNQESYEKFNQRRQRGEIPSYARIGGGIGIHGTWPHEDYQIDRYQNWTDGCISLKNSDVEELYRYIPVGTQVTIRK